MEVIDKITEKVNILLFFHAGFVIMCKLMVEDTNKRDLEKHKRAFPQIQP